MAAFKSFELTLEVRPQSDADAQDYTEDEGFKLITEILRLLKASGLDKDHHFTLNHVFFKGEPL